MLQEIETEAEKMAVGDAMIERLSADISHANSTKRLNVSFKDIKIEVTNFLIPTNFAMKETL